LPFLIVGFLMPVPEHLSSPQDHNFEKIKGREKKRTQFSLTREEMKNCIWLKPQLVGQIEFTEWTPDGHLRHSRFVGLRDDKKPHDVLRE
jgi:ATP-dependent DNA ligase